MSCALIKRTNSSERGKKAWTPEFRSKQLNQTVSDEKRLLLSQKTTANWSKPEVRARITDGIKKAANTEETARKRAEALTKYPRISSFNRAVALYLNACGIEYQQEAVFDRWTFDFYIPARRLLIEVQGEFFHNLPEHRNRDQLKANYVKENLPDHSLIYVSELDLAANRIGTALGIQIEKKVIDFKYLSIGQVDVKEARDFYNAFHYLGGQRGIIRYGLFYGSELIGVCSFGSFQRDEQAKKWKDAVELTRFCLHPAYQIRNLGSWFLSRCLKLVGKTVITYADTEFHTGALYKASNFIFSHATRSDYHYLTETGERLHKKTVWERAKANHLKEAEYADRHELLKVVGKKKLCFTYLHGS